MINMFFSCYIRTAKIKEINLKTTVPVTFFSYKMINNYLERQIKENFPYQPTPEQEIAIKSLSDFLLAPRSEMVFLLRGYAGTGKTSLVGALVRTLDKLQQKSVLLASDGAGGEGFLRLCGTSGVYNS